MRCRLVTRSERWLLPPETSLETLLPPASHCPFRSPVTTTLSLLVTACISLSMVSCNMDSEMQAVTRSERVVVTGDLNGQ